MKIARLLFVLLCFSACRSVEVPSNMIAFKGATIIDGTGGDPIPNGVLIVNDGRIMAVGEDGKVAVPAGAVLNNVSGKTIIPGIINAHGHVGDVKGIEGGHYSRENVIDNLAIYARYGITTVVSLGGDRQESVAVRAVNDTSTQHARLFIAGEVISGNTPEEAAAVAEKNHAMGVDFMKIRVDDNLRTSQKMSEEVYRAVIKRSHDLGYKIATHMYYLEDARRLLEAGSDLLAHSVRDKPVDDAFVSLLLERKVGYCPTLTRELSTFVYGDTADFFSDPFFTREYNSSIFEPLNDPERQARMRASQSAKTYRSQLPVAMANLKTLSDRGVPIVFGTDSGIPTRFIGYFEHLEMRMMAEAGMTPMQILVSATKNAATCMGLKDLGTLSQGNHADFIVLDSDPLSNIENVEKISDVYIGGRKLKR